MTRDDRPTDGITRRTTLKAVGAGALSFGFFGTAAATRNDCELDPCTEAFLLSKPVELPASQWDGSIVHNKPLVKVGAGVELPDGSEIPFAFDPIVTCVQAGTTVRWKWLNQKSITSEIPVTVHHNVDIFQFPDDCEAASDIEDLAGVVDPSTFVTSGHPVGFNPPDDKKPKDFEYTFDEPGVYPYYCEPHGAPETFPDPDSNTSENEALDDYHPPPGADPDGPLGDPQNLLGMRGAVIVTEKKGKGKGKGGR